MPIEGSVITAKLEAAKVSIKRRLYEKPVVYLCQAILLSNKKEKKKSEALAWMNLQKIMKSEQCLIQRLCIIFVLNSQKGNN